MENVVFLTLDQTRKKVGLSVSSIYRLVKKGDFPAPVRLIGNRGSWVEGEVNAWLQAKIEQRNEAAA